MQKDRSHEKLAIYAEINDASQFWEELDDLLSVRTSTPALVQMAVKDYLAFAAAYRSEYLTIPQDVAKCCFMLLDSGVFIKHKGFVRRQLVSQFLTDAQDNNVCYIIASLLLLDGRTYQKTLELLHSAKAFPLVIDLLASTHGQEKALNRLLLDLLFEICRVQRVDVEQLEQVDEEFICILFELVETNSGDEDDPDDNAAIRGLLALNEQYMVAAHAPTSSISLVELKPPAPFSAKNLVVHVLSTHGSSYRCFGEKIILMLNRERQASCQLLILKILFLLFTTPATYEYFYTNDLRVLVDVFIRELYDLPLETDSLRHTYLRVLYPLLSHTQLRNAPHYKRKELLYLLKSLTQPSQFTPVDATTQRLVDRCLKVVWLQCNIASLTTPLSPIGMSMSQLSSASVADVAKPKKLRCNHRARVPVDAADNSSNNG